jgi:hypothetical protein
MSALTLQISSNKVSYKLFRDQGRMMHQKCQDSDTSLQVPNQSVPPVACPGDALSIKITS